jgi:hypothetical protein
MQPACSAYGKFNPSAYRIISYLVPKEADKMIGISKVHNVDIAPFALQILRDQSTMAIVRLILTTK